MKYHRLFLSLFACLGVFLAGALTGADNQDTALPEEPFTRGVALLEQGQFADARLIFHELLQNEPLRKELFFFRGVSAIRLNEPDAAWNDFSRILELDAGDALGYVGLAKVWTFRNNPAEALKAVDKAIELDPVCAEAYYEKGIVLGYQKNLEGAIIALKRDLELKPDHAMGHYQLGLAYNQQKRKDVAISHLERFLALAPNAPEAEQVRNLLNFLRR